MNKNGKQKRLGGDRGSVSMRALFTVKGILFVCVAWWIYRQPHGAAAAANRGLAALEHFGNSAAAFLSALGT